MLEERRFLPVFQFVLIFPCRLESGSLSELSAAPTPSSIKRQPFPCQVLTGTTSPLPQTYNKRMQQGPSRVAPKLRTWILPLSVFLIGVACSIAIAAYIQSAWDAKEKTRYDQAVVQTTQNINGLIDNYLTLGRGASGLFASDASVNAEEFRRFTKSIAVESHFPGLQGVGFLRVVPNEGLAPFQKEMAKVDPKFEMWPETKAEFHAPILFAASGPGAKDPTGFDMAADPIRRAAIRAALDTGRQAMTRVDILGSPKLSLEPPEKGFLIFMPIYKEGSLYLPTKSATSKPFGVIYLAFRGARLIQGIQSINDHPPIAFDLYIGTPTDANFISSSYEAQPNWQPRFTSESTFQIADRVLSARFHDTPELQQLSDLPLAREIMIAGIIISALLFALTWGAARSGEAAFAEVAVRKRAEEALEAREHQLSTVLDAMPVGVWLLDRSGKILFANPAGERITPPAGAEDSTTGIDQRHIAVAAKRSLESGIVTLNEVAEISTHDGKRLTLLNSAVPLRDNKGEIVGAVVVSEDISQRIHAEAALIETEHRFRVMADLAPVLLWVAGPDREFTWFNKPWLDYVGHTMERELGVGWASSVHEGDLEGWQSALLEAFETRKPFEIEFRLKRADGQYRWFLNRGVPRFDATGDFVGYIGSCVDIEDRKQAEVTMKSINATLERWVAERTRDLKRTIDDMESFSYTVAHDLRAPLRAMGGYAQMLQEDFKGNLTPEAITYVTRIKENSAKMAQLIDGLLDLARISRADLHRDTINLTDIAREVATGLQLRNPERHATITIEDGMVALGDERLITLVMQNLLENSWKFTERKEVTRINVCTAEPRDGSTVFFVKDNGAGFDMAHIGKLFGTFERLHRPDEFPGSGIGLASVKRIIERHRGRVWAEGAVDGGATFYFSLPKVQTPQVSQASLV